MHLLQPSRDHVVDQIALELAERRRSRRDRRIAYAYVALARAIVNDDPSVFEDVENDDPSVFEDVEADRLEILFPRHDRVSIDEERVRALVETGCLECKAPARADELAAVG